MAKIGPGPFGSLYGLNKPSPPHFLTYRYLRYRTHVFRLFSRSDPVVVRMGLLRRRSGMASERDADAGTAAPDMRDNALSAGAYPL